MMKALLVLTNIYSLVVIIIINNGGFLNQAHAKFLKITFVHEVCVWRCVSAPKAINSQWHAYVV